MSNTPKIRFSGFTEDWEQRKFGELGSVAMCKRIFKEQTSPVGDIPFYKIGTFGAEPDAFISRELFEEYKEKFQYPKIGDMLISASGTIGRTVEYDGEEAYFQDSNIVWFKHDERVDNSFLKCIYGIIKWSGIEGSTIKRLYNDNFLKTEFYMPSVAEQEKIGEYFANLDHLITLHQRKYDDTKLLKKYMLQKMFPQNGQKVPEIRFSGFTGDWEQRKLGELTIYRNGTGHEEKQSESGRYELINLNSISIDGGLKPSGKYIDEEIETLLKDDLVMVLSDVGHGDLLGRVAIIPENNRFVLNQRVALLRNNSSVDIKYLFSYINAHQIYFKKQGAGSSQLNISRGSVENFEVLLPNKDEQKKIGKYFENLDHLITLHQRKCDELQELKKYMLQNMFPQKG